MILKLTDKSEIVITQAQADKISMELKVSSTEKNPFIFVNNQPIKKTMIAGIFPGGRAEDEPKIARSHQISEPKYNCGPWSIQLQIQKYAIRHREIRRLKDEAYREKVRLALRKQFPDRKWCDHRENEHACLDAPEGQGSDITKQHLANIRKVFVDIDASRGQIR